MEWVTFTRRDADPNTAKKFRGPERRTVTVRVDQAVQVSRLLIQGQVVGTSIRLHGDHGSEGIFVEDSYDAVCNKLGIPPASRYP